MRLKHALLLAAAILLCTWTPTGGGEGKDPDALTKEKKRSIKKALQLLSSGKDEAVDRAMKMLDDAGPASVPFIEAEIKKRRDAALPFLCALAKVRGKWGIKTQADDTTREKENVPIAPEIYLEKKFEWARELFKNGRYARASAITRAILVLDPNVAFRRDALLLAGRAVERVIQKTTVQVTFELENNVFEVGEAVEFQVRIANLSGNTVEIRPISEKKSPFGRLKKLVEVYNLRGDYNKVHSPLPVDLTETVTLAPGKAWVKRLLIPTRHLDADAPLFRRFTIEGSILPGGIFVDGKPIGRRLYFKPVSFDIVPRGLRVLARKPLKSLETALIDAGRPQPEGALKDFNTRIFMSAFLLDEEMRPRGVDLLMKYLPKLESAPQRVVMAALRGITGKDVPYDVDAWQEWYIRKFLKKN